MKILFRSPSLKAFTLAETVIAMAVVGLLLTTFMGVFLPSRKSIQSSLSIQEADRLASSLSTELATLRSGEKTQYPTAFDKAFDWMQQSKEANTTVLIYNYRGDLNKGERPDGSLRPFVKEGAIPGQNTLVTPAVVLAQRDMARIREDMKALVGPVFLVKMTQLVWDTRGSAVSSSTYGANGGKYVLAKRPGVIANPYNDGKICNSATAYVYNLNDPNEQPWGAEVLFNAAFYQIPIAQPEFIQKARYAKLKTPVFSRNLSFRR